MGKKHYHPIVVEKLPSSKSTLVSKRPERNSEISPEKKSRKNDDVEEGEEQLLDMEHHQTEREKKEELVKIRTHKKRLNEEKLNKKMAHFLLLFLSESIIRWDEMRKQLKKNLVLPRVADVEGAQERRSTKGHGLLRKEGPPTYVILSQNLVLS